jgi:hypothetical protein
MRSGLTGGCSSMAGVAFGTILFLIGDPHVGQGCRFLVSSRNFSLFTVASTFVFMRSRPLAWRINHYSGVLCLAVAIRWGADLLLNRLSFPR